MWQWCVNSRALILPLLVAAIWGAPARTFAQDAPPTLRAGSLSDGLAFDGLVNETAWTTDESTDAFTQTEPTEGAPPTGRTIVRVLAGPKAIVIGIICDDPVPDGIVSFSVRRDAALNNEDHVRIVMGPFLDGMGRRRQRRDRAWCDRDLSERSLGPRVRLQTHRSGLQSISGVCSPSRRLSLQREAQQQHPYVPWAAAAAHG